MIQWPCIFKLEGDNELIYFASEQQLRAELAALIWSDADKIIDAQGHSFNISINANNELVYQALDGIYGISDINSLIQAHHFANAQVCLTKLQFTSIKDAITSLTSER